MCIISAPAVARRLRQARRPQGDCIASSVILYSIYSMYDCAIPFLISAPARCIYIYILNIFALAYSLHVYTMA